MKTKAAKFRFRSTRFLIGCLFTILCGSAFTVPASSGPISLTPISGMFTADASANNEENSVQPVMFNQSVKIDETTAFIIGRTTPSPYPNTTEFCSLSINGTYAQLSTSPAGPFTSTLTNVALPSNATGTGTSALLYIRGIEPTNGLAMVTSCPQTAFPVTYWDVLPALRIHIAYSGITTVGVGESRVAHVEIDFGVPNFSGTVELYADQQASSTAPRYFGLSPARGAFQNRAALSLPVVLDANGSGSVDFRFRGLESSSTLQKIYAEFTDGVSNRLATTLLDIVRIESIWFERAPGEVPIDNNPHVGKGLRVFPEKKTPTDTSFHRNKVIVKAKLSKPKSMMYIDFRIFDVDDPEFVISSDTNGQVYVDFNGTLGNDNRGASSLYPVGTQGFTDSSGIASIYVQVSPQPGDNIKIGASALGSQDFGVNDSLDSVRTADISIPVGTSTIVAGVELADSAGNFLTDTGDSRAAAVATKLLTTWRRLHIEVDSMGAIAGNFLSGQIVDTTTLTFTSTKLTTNLTMEKGRSENGRIELTQGGVTKSCKVTSSSINTVTVPCAYNDSLIGATFKLFDDDDMNGNDTSPDGDNGEDVPAPELRLLKDEDDFATNSFASVYVRPTYDLSGNRSDLPVYINAPKADPTATDSTTAEKAVMTQFNNEATRKDKEFWTAYVVQAYQLFTQADDDPTNDAAANGITPFIGESGATFGSICYQENVAEVTNHVVIANTDPSYNFFTDWGDTPIHELMHQLRAKDGDGGRIDGVFAYPSGQSQNRIRSTKVPFMADMP